MQRRERIFSKLARTVLALVPAVVLTQAAWAQTFTTLVSFSGVNGANPTSSLIQGTDGKLYGTTEVGGTDGEGTVFRISFGGTLSPLYSFDLSNGAYPNGVVQATDGNFYGTTAYGLGGQSYGTIFKITPGGALTTLYSFVGDYPVAGVVQATNRTFYGTTYSGGTNGYGTIFKFIPGGAPTTLHSFDSTDGANPTDLLVQATNGSFYGTTSYGGTNGYGTIFKITPGGALMTLYSFDGTNGSSPRAGLMQATNGLLYGTTEFGGANGYGTVFKITPSGTLTTLYSFCSQSGCTDGQNPAAGLVQATDGDLYGTTMGLSSGPNYYGTIFKITPSGTLATLYSFCSQSGCADGQTPVAGLVQATNGDFYGTTYLGGASGDGTVFCLSVGLGPFVETLPISGTVGTAIKILGTGLNGAISVSFNGIAAAFEVVSTSEIITAVPAGASSGKVQVVTPSRTLSSNVAFRVLP